MNKISDNQEKAEFVNFINVLLWGDESSWMDEDTEVERQYRGYQYDRYDCLKNFREVESTYGGGRYNDLPGCQINDPSTGNNIFFGFNKQLTLSKNCVAS